jgi:hypothetical protein
MYVGKQSICVDARNLSSIGPRGWCRLAYRISHRTERLFPPAPIRDGRKPLILRERRPPVCLTHMYVCMYVCMYVYFNEWSSNRVLVRIVYVCIYVCIYIQRRLVRKVISTTVCIQTFIHKYIYMYTHTHTYINTYTPSVASSDSKSLFTIFFSFFGEKIFSISFETILNTLEFPSSFSMLSRCLRPVR